ncbi:hypothetical protein [Allonocardiopsis opalescens]|uniref:Uncharacterized protein n=1 Tax=Allonocardiopsis opalescens TaxID=1144618 RepID=A0A2T0Q4F6_9ACTN|nr:hypothetical protein [Allonocardiopsis opalescens]PRX98686.1 hypothetical protein CLV72_104265 [Allonocardiopsis opalescens]
MVLRQPCLRGRPLSTGQGHWIGAAPSPEFAGGTAAHADAACLAALDGAGLAAELVCTHTDRAARVAALTLSARLAEPPDDRHLADLARRLGGAAVRPGAAEAASGAASGAEAAARAAASARAGEDGRCVRFPGQDALTGVVAAGRIAAESAIDRVAGVGVAVHPDALVDTRDFLRPVFRGGALVLLVEPAAGGLLRPAEIEHPHACCGGH